jgi:hypothetical protein
MNVHWVRSNEALLSLLTITMVTVCVLSALVVHQQHGQRGTPNASWTAIVPELSNAPAIPDRGTTPAQPAPQLLPVPAEAVVVPRLDPTPIRHRTPQPKARPQRLAHPVPAMHRPAPVQPAIPAPATDPATHPVPPANPDRTPRKNDTPSQSGPSTGYSRHPHQEKRTRPGSRGNQHDVASTLEAELIGDMST